MLNIFDRWRDSEIRKRQLSLETNSIVRMNITEIETVSNEDQKDSNVPEDELFEDILDSN